MLLCEKRGDSSGDGSPFFLPWGLASMAGRYLVFFAGRPVLFFDALELVPVARVALVLCGPFLVAFLAGPALVIDFVSARLVGARFLVMVAIAFDSRRSSIQNLAFLFLGVIGVFG
jgi:hypothetical protein